MLKKCTDNDKYNHSLISLLDFLNSLPIFFPYMYGRESSMLAEGFHILRRFHIISMSKYQTIFLNLVVFCSVMIKCTFF